MTRGWTSGKGEDLPIVPRMDRLGMSLRLALLLPLLAAVVPACRRAGPCPPGQEEVRDPSAEAFWCRSKDGKAGQYVQLHPGSRQWRQRCTFSNGVLDGPFEGAHPEGQRWVQGRYQDGHLAGRWVQWSPTGQKVAEGEYRDGRLISGAPVAVASICETAPRLP
jgi:hypothetical protein